MANHSQRSNQIAARDGGDDAASPGRRPRGARQIQAMPACSSMPSDWYEAKSCSAAMQERKAIVHKREASRGITLSTRTSDAARPTHTMMLSARSLEDSQNSVGAIQYRLAP